MIEHWAAMSVEDARENLSFQVFEYFYQEFPEKFEGDERELFKIYYDMPAEEPEILVLHPVGHRPKRHENQLNLFED